MPRTEHRTTRAARRTWRTRATSAAAVLGVLAVVAVIAGPGGAMSADARGRKTPPPSTPTSTQTPTPTPSSTPTGGTAAANADCSAGRVLTMVAHADDDLLFSGTELRADIDAGKCVRSVIVTAGDAGKPAWYWQSRENGLMASYASIAGVSSNWTAGQLSVASHTLRTATLTTAPRLSLVFLELPDGNIDGSGFAATGSESLEKLSEGQISTIHTVAGAAQPTSFSLTDLRATFSGLVTGYAPTEIHTLDHGGTYGDGDHSDHHTVAYLADQAQSAYTAAHTFTGYLGYPIADRPSNLSSAQTAAKAAAFFAYAAYDGETCGSTSACASRPEGSWLSRQYAVGSSAQPPTDPPTSQGTDVTAGATVTASAENPADGQTAVKAVDGVVSGYPDAPTAEWAAPGGRAGTWIQLNWSAGTTLHEIDLADRPNSDDQVTGGTLTFSDGTSVAVPSLDNGGAVQRVAFSARQVTWVRFTVGSVSSTTRNVGLAEIRAFRPADTTTPTPADVTGSATPTAAWDDQSTGQTVAKAVDGVVSGYPDNLTAEWVAPWGRTGVWIQLDWAASQRLGRIVLHDRPNSSDQVTSGTLTFSDGSQVAVGTLPNGGDALTVDFTPRDVTWVRFTVTGVSNSTGNVGLSEIRAWTTG
ncbi:PIG-L family deacetylase [Curtobacterium sp. MCLR17_058]|uniref:DUF7402 domain-containing protein n=1 Tax=Curtobacterium sp. MCLR17_058 TaxID=2175635 RepID=UPI000DA87BE6|nr:PIG-L family deacetylase [Curtobacterium sp. MCLR17_058]WIB41461.1 PIG-L family deacetylase [Curtobacterium sp. MCLR17_058]